jgi:hypothetical protein
MLSDTKGAITNGQSRETGKIGYTRHKKNKRQRIPKGHSQIYNPEKLATYVASFSGLYIFDCPFGIL